MAKVFKTLKKKAQATPLVGVILDSLKSENPRQNAPSIQAVLDNLQPKQHIINPDFQVNQRGQSSYVQNKDELKLTVDCWIMASSSWEKTTVIPLKEGIRIQSITLDEGGVSYSNSFTQILENEPEGDKTIIINVTNLTGHAKFGVLDKKDSGVILDKKELVKGINIFHFNINEERNLIIRYFIDKNTDISIEYTNLFEGDIAYPHVKKSYQDDLWECMSYIQRIRGVFISQYSTSYESQTFINLKREMIETPTIVEWELDTFSYNSIGNIIINSKKLTNESYNPKNVINVLLTYEADEVIKRIKIDFIASCEPL